MSRKPGAKDAYSELYETADQLTRERDDARAHRERLVREAATAARELNRLTAELATCREHNAGIATQLDEYRDWRDDARGHLDEIRSMAGAAPRNASAEQLAIILRAIRADATEALEATP